MIKLIIEPRIVKTWEQFCRENPHFSIALDGYVSGPPRETYNPPRMNLNHHEGVNRLSTLSTCYQVLIRLKLGLFDRFKQDNEERAFIYINDLDQDTSLAFWLLKNHDKLKNKKIREKIEKLVEVENLLDITFGMYPFDPNSDIMQKIAWIFQPYTDARIFGNISMINSKEMYDLLEKISERINGYVLGKSKKLKLDTKYKVIYKNKNYVMIKEIGAHARLKLLSGGIKAFISVKKRLDNKYNYVIARASPLINFPIPKICDKLNKIENTSYNNRWGGNPIIIGSPKQTGSKIIPEKLIKIINKEL